MSFSEWLSEQKDRGDPVADLAGDASSDRDFPKDGTYFTYSAHLSRKGACHEAQIALKEAWMEFSGEDPEDLKDPDEEVDEDIVEEDEDLEDV